MKLILTSLFLVNLIFLVNTGYARDPDAPPPEYYGERETVGGSEWTGGDTFLCITLPLVVAAIMLLPHIFDGKSQDWPVYKFSVLNLRPNVLNLRPYKFPTRRLCIYR